MVSGFVVAESAQCFYDGVLSFGLPGVDDIVNLGHVAEVRMFLIAIRS